MWITSFDIGIKNFAFAILDVNTDLIKSFPFIPSMASIPETFDVVHVENIDLTENVFSYKTNDMNGIFRNLIEVLDSFQMLWSSCDVFLVEQQMQYRHASNIKALKLSQHVLSYFFIHHTSKSIIEYPAYYKTQVWNAPSKLRKHERKKWAIENVKKLFENKTIPYEEVFQDIKKKDDVSDCVLMCLAYAFQKK
jgi:hypothetical protein